MQRCKHNFPPDRAVQHRGNMSDSFDDPDSGWTEDPQDRDPPRLSSSRDPLRAAPLDVCKMEVSCSQRLQIKCFLFVKMHRGRVYSVTRVRQQLEDARGCGVT